MVRSPSVLFGGPLPVCFVWWSAPRLFCLVVRSPSVLFGGPPPVCFVWWSAPRLFCLVVRSPSVLFGGPLPVCFVWWSAPRLFCLVVRSPSVLFGGPLPVCFVWCLIFLFNVALLAKVAVFDTKRARLHWLRLDCDTSPKRLSFNRYRCLQLTRDRYFIVDDVFNHAGIGILASVIQAPCCFLSVCTIRINFKLRLYL